MLEKGLFLHIGDPKSSWFVDFVLQFLKNTMERPTINCRSVACLLPCFPTSCYHSFLSSSEIWREVRLGVFNTSCSLFFTIEPSLQVPVTIMIQNCFFPLLHKRYLKVFTYILANLYNCDVMRLLLWGHVTWFFETGKRMCWGTRLIEYCVVHSP